MQSLKSTALEPTRAELASSCRRRPADHAASARLRFADPHDPCSSRSSRSSFPRHSRRCSISVPSSGDKAIIAILSLAAMIPMMAGRIDLTVGYGIVLWHILAIALQTKRDRLADRRPARARSSVACSDC